MLCTAGQIPAPSRDLSLDIGLGSRPPRANELAASRHEDFNNDDDDDEPHSDEFQTYSVGYRWNEELTSATSPVLEVRQDIKFIDDEVDSELDDKEPDRNTTTNIPTSDEDFGTSDTGADLGRRWGTVDLIPKPTLPSPNTLPLKSIIKSPKSSSEKTLSDTKKGISFSQDTVFK